MVDIIDFIRDFGSVIDLIFILALFGILFKINKQTLSQKDAHIQLLNERIAVAEQYSVEKFANKYHSLKVFYENSIDALEIEKQEAIKNKEGKLITQIEEEIKKREEMKKRYTEIINKFNELREDIDNIDICGKYKIMGKNPGSTSYSYSGMLEINKTGEIYSLFWRMRKPDRQFRGVGLLKGNLLSVAFEGIIMGIVVYEIDNQGTIRGIWTGCNEKSFGIEEGTKI